MNNEVINAIKELQNRLNNVHGEDAMLETIDNYVAELKGELKKLKDLSWSEIKTILYSGDAERVLRVGDEKEFELYTGEKVKAKLISLNPHDVRADYSPATKAKATFMFYVDGEYEMNEECTNVGGWKDSKMRNTYMPRFYKLLPSDLQALILPVKKKTSAGGESEEIVETTDKLFLPSEIEIAGTTDCSCEGEGELYEYFKNSNMPYTWTWLRSPYPSITYGFASGPPMGMSVPTLPPILTGWLSAFVFNQNNQSARKGTQRRMKCREVYSMEQYLLNLISQSALYRCLVATIVKHLHLNIWA